MLHIEALFDDIYARYYLAIVRYAITKRQSKENAEEIANETLHAFGIDERNVNLRANPH